MNTREPIAPVAIATTAVEAAETPDRPPFIGLRPFGAADEGLFFGRRDQTSELLERLREHRFIAVVGGSGSGKSSLVKAGLIPAVTRGWLVHDRHLWLQITMRPGIRPLDTLFDEMEKLPCRPGALRGYLGAAPPEASMPRPSMRSLIEERPYDNAVEEYLRSQIFPIEAVHHSATLEVLTDATDEDAGEPDGSAIGKANLLLFIDQFEEVFRYALSSGDKDGANQAQKFVKLILRLAEQDATQIFVVTTMRSDFLGACEAFPGLTMALNRGVYFVPRLTRPQLTLAIEEPLVRNGGAISRRLLDQLLNDCMNQPQGSRGESIDQLPLLQHALMRTWEEWQHTGGKGPVDLPHYDAAGTMQRALKEQLEQVWSELNTEQKLLAERLFRALTDTDPANRQIRRPSKFSELIALTGATRQQIVDVLKHFNRPDRAFVTWDASDDDPIVDISHESLIRKWDRLGDWASEEAKESLVYEWLIEATALQQTQQKAVWTDPRRQPQFASVLQVWSDGVPPRAWAERLPVPRTAEMPPLRWNANQAYDKSTAFLSASRNRFVWQRKWRWLEAALAIVVAAGVAFAVRYFENERNDSIQAALLPGLVDESTRLLDHDPVVSVLLATEAVQRAEKLPDPTVTLLARQALDQSVNGWGGEFKGKLPSGSDDGSQIVQLVADAGASWYAVTRRGAIYRFSESDKQGTPFARDGGAGVGSDQTPPRVVRLAVAGTRVAMQFESGVIKVGELGGSSWTSIPRASNAKPSALGFSADGRWTIIGAEDGSVQFWDAKAPFGKYLEAAHHGADERIGGPHFDPVGFIKASPGRILAGSGEGNGPLRAWRLTENGPVAEQLPAALNVVTTADVSATGTWLFAGVRPSAKDQPAKLQLWSIPTASNHAWSSQPEHMPFVAQNNPPTNAPGNDPSSSMNAPPSIVTTVAVSADGKWAISAFVDGSFFAYHNKKHTNDSREYAEFQMPIELLRSAPAHRQPQLVISPDSHWLAIESDADVHLVDLVELDQNISLGSDSALPIGQAFQSFTFSNDSRWFVGALADGTVWGWQLETLGSKARRPLDDVSQVQLSADGSRFAAGTSSGQVLLAALDDPHRTATSLAFGRKRIALLELSANKRWALAADVDGAAKLWRIDRRPEVAVDFPHVKISTAKFNADGTVLWTSSDGRLSRWSLQDDGPPESWLRLPEDVPVKNEAATTMPYLSVLAVTPERIVVAWGSQDPLIVSSLTSASGSKAQRQLEILNATDLKHPIPIALHQFGVVVSPDGRWIVNSIGGVDVWDLNVKNRQPIRLQVDNATPAARFSRDGKWLVVAQRGGRVLAYSTEQWNSPSHDGFAKPIELRGASIEDEVSTLAVSTDNHWVTSSDRNGMVLVLDLTAPAAPAQRLPMFPEDGTVADAEFRDDGTLVTASTRAVVRRWNLRNLDVKKLLELAATKTGRNLLCNEWRAHFWKLEYKPTFLDDKGEDQYKTVDKCE